MLTAIILFFVLAAFAAAIYLWRVQQSTIVQLAASQTRAGHAEKKFAASKGAIEMIASNLADTLSNPKGSSSS